mgnify:CR=1 FL=1
MTPAVRGAIGLEQVPRLTTLQAFADRPDIPALLDHVLASVGRAVSRARPRDAAIDGTGLEVASAPAHSVSGAGRERTTSVKVMLGVRCASVIPVALVVDRGPSHDVEQAWTLREKLKATCGPTTPRGDGAFDSGAWHRANWEGWGVPSYAPATARSADGRAGGLDRSAFQTPVDEHGRRWMCESVNSAIKRISGGTLRSLEHSALLAGATLKVAAYAIKVQRSHGRDGASGPSIPSPHIQIPTGRRWERAMTSIESEFRDRGILRGGILFVRQPIALEMVRVSRKRNVKILGIEGFRLADATTQPIPEHSIDLSKDLFREAECWDRAEKFLNDRPGLDIYFEVDLYEPQ